MEVKKKKSRKDKIVIDPERGLVFDGEDELFAHFHSEIAFLEKDFESQRNPQDIPREDFRKFDRYLTLVLEDPDEIWEDDETIAGKTLYHFLGSFKRDKNKDSKENPENKAAKPPKRVKSTSETTINYIAVAYMVEEKPVFVFLHFPSRFAKTLEHYRRGELIYNKAVAEIELGAAEGDALSEGDPLAVGLYRAMLKVRADFDISENKFHEYVPLRERTIEEADEIWRSTDFQGNVLVTFFKEFLNEEHSEIDYIVVTLEDSPSNSHVLLFSFPTVDKQLVDRYRHGENLQADEVVQESSH